VNSLPSEKPSVPQAAPRTEKHLGTLPPEVAVRLTDAIVGLREAAALLATARGAGDGDLFCWCVQQADEAAERGAGALSDVAAWGGVALRRG
jgi:hypothetical protein